MILSMAVSDPKSGNPFCYTGGTDGSIRMWRIPAANSPTYTPYDPKINSGEVLAENLDAVWCLRAHPVKNLVVSVSANGLVKLWSPETKKSILTLEKAESASPTSADFLHTDLKKIVVSYSNSKAHVFDIETGKPILELESNATSGDELSFLSSSLSIFPSFFFLFFFSFFFPTNIFHPHPFRTPFLTSLSLSLFRAVDNSPLTQINQIITHPTLPLAITGHEDKYIRFFDLNTGSCANSMVAHLDAVSSLAINPNGLGLVSGGHDSSVRFWDINSRACTQEFTSHRKKYSEGVHSLAFHPTTPILASGGADATVRVYN